MPIGGLATERDDQKSAILATKPWSAKPQFAHSAIAYDLFGCAKGRGIWFR